MDHSQQREEHTDELLTTSEAAAVMRVSKTTVHRLVHSGLLPATRVGRSFRIHRHDLQGYLRDAQVGPSRPAPDPAH